MLVDLDRKLSEILREFPARFQYRYTPEAAASLLETLFRALTGDRPDYLSKLFPDGPGYDGEGNVWKLSEAQEGAEYTEAARGHRCGHILKNGEASYHCHTCTDDPTACLCSRCFDASDHEGHTFTLSQSIGNSGCCDCGDDEAWKIPMNCAIHTADPREVEAARHNTNLPPDFVRAIETTIGRALDYFCDVISCSPENLRLSKSEDSVKEDEFLSRLSSKYYGPEPESNESPEYSLIIWNDEKHTIEDVEAQVARACSERKSFGTKKANEANDYGRSVVKHSQDLPDLLRISKIIEQIKITVTIRSSRDTFREQMCGTIVEWLSDIAACQIDGDSHILRETICKQMLQIWRIGSEAYNIKVGKDGMDDHGQDDKVWDARRNVWGRPRVIVNINNDSDDDDDIDPVDNGELEDDLDEDLDEFEAQDDLDMEDAGDGMDIDEPTEESAPVSETDAEQGPIGAGEQQSTPGSRTRSSGQRRAPSARRRASQSGPSEQNPDSPNDPSVNRNYGNVPKTPARGSRQMAGNQSRHWITLPHGHRKGGDVPFYEDLAKNIRLDNMILFDLRLWKKTRIDLRDLYISTVVNIPEFKRILGLRFAGLYTSLASLYLIADREPDHSIINLSLQMLTSQSITDEVIESGNFLTNLMAILYTFLTTRQVGLPKDVNSTATLAFDAGSVNNRRLYHFFTDLRHFLKSEAVQLRVRTQDQYLRQFLDLVKLAQGICPNVRAVGEHVEYETDAWISASLLSREINKLCREFPEAFRPRGPDDLPFVSEALFTTTMTTIVNSVGLESQRFDQAEVKDMVKSKYVMPFDFDFFEADTTAYNFSRGYRLVDFVVSEGQVSFHHALHYTLSWLLEGAKSLSREQVQEILLGAAKKFLSTYAAVLPSDLLHGPEDALFAMFDYPLRVCAWLAQMKANMWVRNGLSLRHQMSQYKGVQFRDVTYHRDIFLLQTAFVTCDPSRVLATIIDRFGMDDWMRGEFQIRQGYTEDQLVDILEDLANLLIVILSDRSSLVTLEEEPNPHLVGIWKDVIHTLCFKPLSYSDLINRLKESVQDQPEFPRILQELTNYKAPEGLTDSGMFELKPQYLEHLDPYTTNYTKNQRDEAENIYKNWMSKKLNKDPADIVPEPKLRRISQGTFVHLHDFTRTRLFGQIMYYALSFTLQARELAPNVTATRIEALLQVILQLVLIATIEDESNEGDGEAGFAASFIQIALKADARRPLSPQTPTIMSVLQQISLREEFSACKSKIKHILRIFCRNRPRDFAAATASMSLPYDRLDTASPANIEIDMEAKKKQALERQKRVMASFQQQQQNFMQNQGFNDWGDADLSDEEVEMPETTETKMWKYPSGVCILCQEETNDSRLYGTFAMLSRSNILRTTAVEDPDYVLEAVETPSSLDRSADDIRPFGVAGQNHQQVRVLDTAGKEIIRDRQGLGKGFPRGQAITGPVSTSCGHIMHYACFENYCQAIYRRHHNQIARNQPERIVNKEFVCPLCKALGNSFLPIIWKGKEESYPGVLVPKESLEDFLQFGVGQSFHRMVTTASANTDRNIFQTYVNTEFNQELANSFGTASTSAVTSPTSPQSMSSFIPRASMPGGFPGRDMLPMPVVTPQGGAPVSPTPVDELQRIYARLRETLRSNFSPWPVLRAEQAALDPVYKSFWALCTTYGYSVSAVEIAHRGLQADVGMTFLDRIPQQTLTHLRILSETAFSFVSSAKFEAAADRADSTHAQLNRLASYMFVDLFSPKLVGASGEGQQPFTSVLTMDTFCALAEKSFILCPLLDLDIHHLVRICYTVEIIKVFLAYMNRPSALRAVLNELKDRDATPKSEPTDLNRTQGMMKWLAEQCKTHLARFNRNIDESWGEFSDEEAGMFKHLARQYALPFVRKATILLHTRYGVEFPSMGLSDIDTPELDRLTRLLRLPTVEEIILTFQYDHAQSAEDDQMRTLAKHWIENYVDDFCHASGNDTLDPETRGRVVDLGLGHPGIFELVGLPKYYDVLMEEAQKRKCPTTGKELTDPSVCLFCGDIFCSQAKCCTNEKGLGGCNQHMVKCSAPVGVFLNIRKCMIVVLHGHSKGSWLVAPYLTKHGEVDPGLRQRHQLILSQKRYDKLLREVWLGHGICSIISRKLEGDVNTGGWETI